MKYPSRGTITLNSASCFLQCVEDVWRVDGVHCLLPHLQHDPGPSLHPLRLQDQVSITRCVKIQYVQFIKVLLKWR
jgi:hypothetical protein